MGRSFVPKFETYPQILEETVDVDPIPRQLLRRADDFFGVLFFLTLPDELAWSQVPK
ncbi:MAG: hypothetical protein LZF62_50001 [Nitrospira sp.]|nr:MAG: hypothetical protein LZF62_50001 [Nitrospira sp.]